MEARLHNDIHQFWSLAEPVISADPVRNTVLLSVLRRLRDAPDPADDAPVLLTISAAGTVIGAAMRATPFPLAISAVPLEAVEVAALALVPAVPDLSSVNGPRAETEAFGAAWSTLTGTTVKEVQAGRLYRLGVLEPPAVPGRARPATDEDVPLLTIWRRDFEVEAFGAERLPGRAEANVRRSMALGSTILLWEHDDRRVSFANVGRPFHGMSRIGPVYTPPAARGRGYGSAVTAAAARLALDAGAGHVLLFTDLANPTSNGIYQRIGFRPVHDTTELEFR